MNKKIFFSTLEFIFWACTVFVKNVVISKITRYLALVTAFIFAFKNGKYSKANKLIVYGLFFTLCADLCLIINEDNKILSLIFFIIVQIIYFRELLYRGDKKLNEIHFFVRCVLIGVSLIFAILYFKLDILVLFTVFYFINLFTNLIFSFVQLQQNKLFAFGLLFFICCDILVGLTEANGIYFIIPESFTIINKILYSGFNFIWTFYIPAQTLIAFSTDTNQEQIIEVKTQKKWSTT